MKIGILGTRGIPNSYGGFEECAEQLAVRLVSKGHEVSVYNSHRHPFSNKDYKGVQLIHKYDPEHRIGTSGQFIYDLNCIIDARWRKFDVLLLLGYTSSSIWSSLMPKKTKIICNMDGLEWKRSKYSQQVQSFLKRAEKWAASYSDLLIADSKEIEIYLGQKYQSPMVHIAYGAEIIKDPQLEVLGQYGLEAKDYNLVIARLEPENNIEMILEGITKSQSTIINIIIGNHETTYGRFLKDKFKDNRIRFIQSNYNKNELQSLRYYSKIYFHGHSVGGTNPSLLEAMACQCNIAAHDNRYNREVLVQNASYFHDAVDITNIIDHWETNDIQKQKVKENLSRIREVYNWDMIADQYEICFEQSMIS